MASAETQIANLLYRYAECIDGGDFAGAAALFARARIRLGEREVGPDEVLAVWRQMVILYDCGTPRTRHVITNPIIEVDEAAGTATCRSVYTVLQQVPGDALRLVINGRYHDRFARDAQGTWHYVWRDYSLHDFPGDMSRHTRNAAWERKG